VVEEYEFQWKEGQGSLSALSVRPVILPCQQSWVPAKWNGQAGFTSSTEQTKLMRLRKV
jgi:hypothetical protein